jgi:sugar/nucleoside kinase (ribokinase family)
VEPTKILLFGDINLDVSMRIPEMPIPGQDVYVDELAFNLGGSATNTAIILTRLGCSSRILGSIGMDPNGEYLLKTLTSYHIDTSLIQHRKERPSGQIFLTVLPDGERTMYSFRGANVLTTPQDILPEVVRQSGLVHISGYTFLESPQRDTARHLIEIAHQYGIPISMDTGLDPVVHAHAAMRPLLKYLSICICGQHEGSLLTGKEEPEEMINAFLDLGIHCTAIKLGKQGCMIGVDGETMRLPALSIQAIDTTGSGDAFSAGLLIAFLNHFRLPEMGALANALGAHAATHLGPISAKLEWSDLLSFLEQNRSRQVPQVQECIDLLVNRLKSDGFLV